MLQVDVEVGERIRVRISDIDDVGRARDAQLERERVVIATPPLDVVLVVAHVVAAASPSHLLLSRILRRVDQG